MKRLFVIALAACLLLALAACSAGVSATRYDREETGLYPGILYGYRDGFLYASRIRDELQEAYFEHAFDASDPTEYGELVRFEPVTGTVDVLAYMPKFVSANSCTALGDYFCKFFCFHEDGDLYSAQLWRVDPDGRTEVVCADTVSDPILYTKEMDDFLLVLKRERVEAGRETITAVFRLDPDTGETRQLVSKTGSAGAGAEIAAMEYCEADGRIWLLCTQYDGAGVAQTLEVYDRNGALLDAVPTDGLFYDGSTTGYLQLERFGPYVYVLNASYSGALAKLDGTELVPVLPMEAQVKLAITGKGMNERHDDTLVFTHVDHGDLFFLNVATGALHTVSLPDLFPEVETVALGYRDKDALFVNCWAADGTCFYLHLSVSELLNKASPCSGFAEA